VVEAVILHNGTVNAINAPDGGLIVEVRRLIVRQALAQR
jgi:hypothetical protein